MRTTQQILTLVTGILGVMLVAKSVWDGSVWPISVQLVAGVLLIVYSVFRWRAMR